MSEDAFERLGDAVKALATSSRSIRDRLIIAASVMAGSKEDDIPIPELRAKFRYLWARLTADKSNRIAGYVPTTVAAMTDSEAEEVARLLWDIYSGLALDQDTR